MINTDDENWQEKMGKICKELKPTACFECISGDMVGIMMDFLAPGGTLILYGNLSK